MSASFAVAVSALIEHQGQVLLLHRSGARDHGAGEWEPVSGRIEAGESPEEAVVREVYEETSLRVAVDRPFDTFHLFRGAERQETIGITFRCLHVDGEVRLSEEHDAFRWVKLSDLSGVTTIPPIESCFRKYVAAFGSPQL